MSKYEYLKSLDAVTLRSHLEVTIEALEHYAAGRGHVARVALDRVKAYSQKEDGIFGSRNEGRGEAILGRIMGEAMDRIHARTPEPIEDDVS